MERNRSVDTVRLLAITAVAIIHLKPFSSAGGSNQFYNFLYVLLNQLARFAVPFFFILSGYFWGLKIRKGHPIWQTSSKTLTRLAVIFFAWSAFYLFEHELTVIYQFSFTEWGQSVFRRLVELFTHPAKLFFEGTKVHLWFLPGLASAVILTSLLLKARMEALLPVIAVAFYLCGLAAKSYYYTPLGINLAGFDVRNGPFFSMIFFVTGYYLSNRAITHRWFWSGALLLLLGVCLHFGEIFYLWKSFHLNPVFHDYVAGTFFLGLGAAMLALSDHPLIRSEKLGFIGELTLGIYTIHFVFVDVLAAFFRPRSSPVMDIVYLFAVIFLSAAAVYLLSRIRWTRRLVV